MARTASRRALAEEPLPVTLAAILPIREIGMIVLSAVALYLFLAISSYSPTDPAWSYAGTHLTVKNLVGQSGAYTADVLLFSLGWVAYLLPLALLAVGIRLVSGRQLRVSWPLFGIRAVGWLSVVLAASTLARLHISAAGELPAGAGGAVGDWLVAVGLPILNLTGLTLAALAILLIGSQSALGYSWLELTERTGKTIYRGAGEAFILFERVLAAMNERRERAAARRQNGREISAKRRTKAKNAAAALPAPEPRSTPTVKTAVVTKPSPRAQQKRLFDLKTSAELPDLELLDEDAGLHDTGYNEESLTAISRLLELKLKDFGIDAEVVSVLPGPVVTRFELQPAPGVKVSRISALVKDLARSLAVISVRVVEVIPGKSVVGVEIPNENREVVRLKEILSSKAYQDASSPLTLAMGKDIAGQAVMADVAKMPHLLVAGTTGSGKSVGVNAMLLSMLYKSTPEDLRLILIDPKMLELAIYEGIPHLLTPVVTDMKEAAQALNWCLGEMERRYRLMAALGVRNLAGYNRRIAEGEKVGQPLLDPLWPADSEDEAPALTHLPLIVVVIDEFADMMMIVGKKVEQLIARIAQKARAAGIHLILATQRPSVDVITGLIKANIPTRISFQVSSKVDSRTILNQGGAEQLLGHGDMLYMPPGTSLPVRVHGAFVSDDEVHRVVSDWKQRGDPDYLEDVLTDIASDDVVPGMIVEAGGDTESSEPLYDEAVAFVLESRRASISAVQRKLRIGYNRAARLIEAMEASGLVSEMNTNGSREVLVPKRD